MRYLGAIVRIFLSVVRHGWQDCPLRSTIALQFVGDDPERFLTLAPNQSAQESLACTLIAARLQQNVDHVTVLVDGTPEILQLAVDSKEDLVQMPVVAESALAPLQFPDILCAKLLTPQPNGFIGYEDAAFRQKILDVSEAQAETMVGPDPITDDLGRETVTVITGSGAFHRRILSSVCSS